MRIAFLHHSLALGSGIDTVVYELARRLGRTHDTTVMTFVSDYPDVAPATLRIVPTSTVRPERMALFGPLDLRARSEVRAFLETQDVVNVHTYPASVLAYKADGPHHVATEWGAVDPTLFSRMTERAYIRVATWAERRYVRAADLVVCPCPFAGRWTNQHFGVEPVVTYVDGVNFELFDRSRVDPVSIFERFPSLRPGPFLLTVGRITPSKNLETLIDAMPSILRAHPSAVLAITGKVSSPAYETALRKQVSNLGLDRAVLFTGRASWEDLARLYAACDVFVVTSLWEGFLRAEPFAMAKPMVAFDIAANPDTIQDGVTGVLVKDHTADAFAQAVVQLLDNPSRARQLGEAGYRWARENLDFDRVAERFRALFEGVGRA
jgi:glycosyltransferase involved in cell wall biosynthesis